LANQLDTYTAGTLAKGAGRGSCPVGDMDNICETLLSNGREGLSQGSMA